jgi:hypothetical protein
MDTTLKKSSLIPMEISAKVAHSAICHPERSGAESKNQFCRIEKRQAKLILRQAQDDRILKLRLLSKSSIGILLGLLLGFAGMARAADPGLKIGPAGIVCLVHGNSPELALTNLADDPGWTNPEVKGFLIRDRWNLVEPSEGKFNFSVFDQSVALARKYHKFVGLGICAGRATPDWVYSDGAQKLFFSRPRNHGTTSAELFMPVPWEPAFQAKWNALIKEFGRRYDSVPEVNYIIMTGPGRDFETFFVSSPADIENFNKLGGLSSWGDAARKIAGFYVASFPHTPVLYAMGPPTPTMEGRETIQSVVEDLFEKYPHQFGVACASLAPRLNPATPSAQMVKKHSEDSTVGFQMLGPSEGGLHMKGGMLADALKVGVDYKAHYIEVYTVDCSDPNQQSALKEANAGLIANAARERKR